MTSEHAYFDVLAICVHLQKYLDGAAKQEVYLFAYLSCLLSLYRERPVSSWGYLFAVTDQAYPYSTELDDAVDLLLQQACLAENEGFYSLTISGHEEYQLFRTMSMFAEREPFIAGACSSLLALPIGTVRIALLNQPEIHGAVSLEQSRLLLSESGLDVLHEHFAALSAAIGVQVSDLVVPAVVWLTYLAEVQRKL